MPRHRRRIEYVALDGVILANTFELPADRTDLNDPPLRWSRVHVAERRVGVERALSGSAAHVAATSRTLVVGWIDIAEERARKEMVIDDPRTGWSALPDSIVEQVPVQLVWWRVRAGRVVERHFHNLAALRSRGLRDTGWIDGLVVCGIDFDPECVLT